MATAPVRVRVQVRVQAQAQAQVPVPVPVEAQARVPVRVQVQVQVQARVQVQVRVRVRVLGREPSQGPVRARVLESRPELPAAVRGTVPAPRHSAVAHVPGWAARCRRHHSRSAPT